MRLEEEEGPDHGGFRMRHKRPRRHPENWGGGGRAAWKDVNSHVPIRFDI